MMIRVKNLQAMVRLGVFDWEQEAPRRVVIQLALEVDGTKAAGSDNLNHTVDYNALSHGLVRRLAGHSYQLIERMVEDVFTYLKDFPAVISAEVEVEKPGAVSIAESVSVVDYRVLR